MATIKDIAKTLGISTSTVSRALNDSYGIKEKTKCIVLAKAKELNYHPNEMARGLVYKKSRTIGLIIPDISDSIFSLNAKGIEEVCAQHNFRVIYYNTNRNFSKEIEAIGDAQKRQMEGIILTPDYLEGEHINGLIKNHYPFILLRRSVIKEEVSFVDVDNLYGTDLIVNHLFNLGHRDIGLITLPLRSFSTKIRLNRCMEILNNLGVELSEKMIIQGNYDEQSGYESFDRLVERGNPTAIFAFNDRMAIGAWLRAKEKKYKIPEDISIIGFDGFNIGQLGYIKLTTVLQDSQKMGRMAAELLLNKIMNKDHEVRQIYMKPELLIGKTTGKFKG